MANSNSKIGQKNTFRPDTKQTITILKAARKSVANAIRASKALGLSITYLKNGAVIKETANGEQTTIKTTQTYQSSKLKEGTVLYAKK
jgi:hypothetical protein